MNLKRGTKVWSNDVLSNKWMWGAWGLWPALVVGNGILESVVKSVQWESVPGD